MAKKTKAEGNPNIVKLWPTTILAKRFAHYQKVNPALLELFYEHRDREQSSPEQAYASGDDLLSRYPLHKELNELAEFISEGIVEVATEANRGLWRQGEKVNVTLTGLWFQISNGFSFHEMHVHGNCSWSGVYYVRSADCSKSRESHRGKQPNGVTRFYGPHIEHMAGGFGDYGNYYLHDSSWDSYPEDGKLCVFPSHIKHMPFPYAGKEDRVIVSFHAQVFNAGGTMNYDYSFNN
ncbi:MAG: 2OG-Fe(II) oxygenase family protein [Gammaproteobacteria bacterium]|nr:2OG-Fe(II) oxygenase family protein [Gammaproteobacteria bacterium]MDH3447446.1 2OG-Fe(II) oxygenase family protein [Gammaproteobacteria bacterium]MDH3547436.1 2OG-Fe(II) oxygenase family protein [Gammaproteobacteria bacterium]